MKVIISGASGYIGTKFINFLKTKVDHISVIVRSQKSQNLVSKILEGQSSHVYRHDLTKELDFDTTEKYDYFIHLAAANDVDSKSPEKALLSTVLSTKNCLDFCKKNQIDKFIYLSTFQVIGSVEGELNESTVHPKNDYAITHKFSEDYIKMYQREHDISYLILRPTNIYGCPFNEKIERWSLVPNCFCKEAYEKQKITLRSSGKQSRDFLNLNDLPEILFESISNFDKLRNRLINLSSGNNFTIFEIAKIVQKVYTEKYNAQCKLEILSEHPLKENEFKIDRTLVKSITYDFKPKESIEIEINQIFKLLEKQNYGPNTTI